MLQSTLKQSHRCAPVRRQSRLRGTCEHGFWRGISRRAARRIVLAAKRFELARRMFGRRNGPLGSIAIDVLDLLANTVDFRSGRLEPSLDWLQRKLKRSRGAIVQALAALRAHGFLDWMRRFEPTGNDGPGPQLKQTSNAYRLQMPAVAAVMLGTPPPLPDDIVTARAARSATEAAYERDNPPCTTTAEVRRRTIADYSSEAVAASPALLRSRLMGQSA